MFIKQISVFIENKEGRLDEVLKILSDGGINLLSVNLADTSEYGVLRLISQKPEKAYEILKNAGFTARIDEVIAVVVPDDVGSLQKVLADLRDGGINITYIYGLSIDGPGAPIAIKTDNQEKASEILKANSVKTITQEELEEI